MGGTNKHFWRSNKWPSDVEAKVVPSSPPSSLKSGGLVSPMAEHSSPKRRLARLRKTSVAATLPSLALLLLPTRRTAPGPTFWVPLVSVAERSLRLTENLRILMMLRPSRCTVESGRWVHAKGKKGGAHAVPQVSPLEAAVNTLGINRVFLPILGSGHNRRRNLADSEKKASCKNWCADSRVARSAWKCLSRASHPSRRRVDVVLERSGRSQPHAPGLSR